MGVAVTWLHDGWLSRFLSARLLAMKRALGKREKPPARTSHRDLEVSGGSASDCLIVELPKRIAYYQSFHGRVPSSTDLRAVVENASGKLTALQDETVSILAKPALEARGYVDLLQVRKSDLQAIEAIARQRGASKVLLSPETAPSQCFLTPDSLRFQRRDAVATASATAVFLLACVALLTSVDIATKRAANAATAAEAALRQEVISRTQQAEAISALQEAASLKLDSMVPAQRLAVLTLISSTLPEHSSLNAVTLDGSGILLVGQTGNAGDVLTAFATRFPKMDATLEQTNSDPTSGLQRFTIRLQEAET